MYIVYTCRELVPRCITNVSAVRLSSLFYQASKSVFCLGSNAVIRSTCDVYNAFIKRQTGSRDVGTNCGALKCVRIRK